jgi:hypothetical protein
VLLRGGDGQAAGVRSDIDGGEGRHSCSEGA